MAEWSSYWRAPDRPVETMHAHFERHVYHRHSHDTYSFGVTDDGAQSFHCRGAAHTSAAGMVMVFNPDEPHDGHPSDELGFTYRMLHVGPELVADALRDATGRTGGAPLFADPVLRDPMAAATVRATHEGLATATPLRRDELLDRLVLTMVRRAATRRAPWPALPRERADPPAACRARELLHDSGTYDLTAADLAAATGRSRFAVYRAFQSAYGLAPSDYQRQLRLRAARRLIAAGHPPAEVAARTGFTDQSHLTRWFTRCYGITPGAYRRAAGADRG